VTPFFGVLTGGHYSLANDLRHLKIARFSGMGFLTALAR